MLVLILSLNLLVFAQVAPPLESVQLQKLIDQSEEQIKSLKKLLNYSKSNDHSLAKANQILEKMTEDINKSIEKYKGTAAYDRALLEIQSKDNYKRTFMDSLEVKHLYNQKAASDLQQKSDFKDLMDFQKESVNANQADLKQQQQLQQALNTAKPGYVAKIHAQTQLGDWKSNTRISSQLTQLISSVQAIREELRLLRAQQSGSGALEKLISGSDMQNRKQREELRR